MNCLFHAFSASLLISKAGRFVARSSICGVWSPSWRTSFQCAGVKAANLEFQLTRFRVQCYSARKSGVKKPRSRKSDSKPAMDETKEPFFVVRKGDIVGVYKKLSDCQAQVGSSICDPPVSVYKGHSMPKETEEYLRSCGLKNALYSIRAADLTEDIFGTLVACPLQLPSSSKNEVSGENLPKKRLQEALGLEAAEAFRSHSMLNDPLRKHPKLEHLSETQVPSSGQSCFLEFDGASKGNPGQAGAGAVLRAGDGSLICRLREGLGIATNNYAEYRGMILGLRYALKKGFTSIRVRGDSKLVCMQIQGLWKVKNQNISNLYEEAKKLKEKFLSFHIDHVLRDLNSEADAQANIAVDLPDGQVQEEADPMYANVELERQNWNWK